MDKKWEVDLDRWRPEDLESQEEKFELIWTVLQGSLLCRWGKSTSDYATGLGKSTALCFTELGLIQGREGLLILALPLSDKG